MGFKNIKSFITIIILFVAAWGSLATSDGKFGLFSGPLNISSDCVSPARINETIQVLDNEISEPMGTTYLDYGFPDAVVGEVSEGTETGTVGGLTRSCSVSYQEDESFWVYSCFDDGEYACTITIENI